MANWKKIAQRIALLLIVPLVVTAFMATNMLNKNKMCKQIVVNIKNKEQVQFVTEKDMQDMLVKSKNITPNATMIKDINIQQLEAVAFNNPWIEDANIYVNNQDELIVDVIQKEPTLRWLNGEMAQSYLDAYGNIIPASMQYSANVPVVTSGKMGMSIAEQKLKKQMVGICNFIQKDSFWNAMITQVNINNNKQFELVPAVANHIILFGDTTCMQDKFNRLFLFYKEAMPRKGWNTYKQLDARFDGQIVAQLADSIAAKKEIILAKTDAKVAPKKTVIASAKKNTKAKITSVPKPKSIAKPNKPKANKPKTTKA